MRIDTFSPPKPTNIKCECGYENKYNDTTVCGYCGKSITFINKSDEDKIRDMFKAKGYEVSHIEAWEVVKGVPLVTITLNTKVMFDLVLGVGLRNIGYVCLEVTPITMILVKTCNLSRF